tara:strand:+ start:654 stop:971 length:318 start_codon:yes stop_codon:yes gene_type:complete
MALQKSYTGQDGGSHSSAYHRVISASQLIDDATVSFRVAVYHNKTIRDAMTGAPMDNEVVKISAYLVPEGSTFTETQLKADDTSLISQCYVYLKTLSAYSGASDV